MSNYKQKYEAVKAQVDARMGRPLGKWGSFKSLISSNNFTTKRKQIIDEEFENMQGRGIVENHQRSLATELNALRRGPEQPDLSPELEKYMLARSVQGRKFETDETKRLISADKTVKETREMLSKGRGNVVKDMDTTNNDSTWRTLAGREMAKQMELDNPGESPGLNSALSAMVVRAGNCGEHGHVAAHLDAKRLQSEKRTNEAVHRVSSTGTDHGWAERRDMDGRTRPTDVLMDAWGEGSAVEREDSRFGQGVKTRYAFTSKNMPTRDFTTMRDNVSKKAMQKAGKEYEELKTKNYRSDHGWAPTSVYSDTFNKQAKTALQTLGTLDKLKNVGVSNLRRDFTKDELKAMRDTAPQRRDLLMDIHKVGVLRTAGASVQTAKKIINGK